MTGKTKAAIDAASCVALKTRKNFGQFRVLVCCPLAAVSVWEDELQRHWPKAYVNAHAHMRWAIINYDKLSRRNRSKKRWVYPWIKRAEKFNPHLIVLDESHRCKRASANRSQALWRLVQRLRKERLDGFPYVYLLTGTPNPKGYQDLFAQFRIMDPSVFGTSKAHFEDEYCVYGHGKLKWTVLGYRHKSELLRKIRAHSITAPELDLPPRMYQVVRVALPSSARKIYNEMADELLTTLEGGEMIEASNPGVRHLRLQQISGGFTTEGGVIHRAKMATASDILFDLCEQDENTIVYCRFLSEVSALRSACRRVGFEAYAVSGSVGAPARAEIIRRLQQKRPGDGKPIAVVFQVETGSLAITLTNAAEVVFYSLPSGWDSYFQATKRVHRIGQDRSVRYRHLVCPGTVDVSILRALQTKASMHHELMRTPNRFVFGEYSLEELQRGFDTIDNAQ